MLAARARGLGTTLTTLLLAAHDDVKRVSGIDEDVTLVACIPLGYPKGRFARPARNPVDAVARLNGRPLPPPITTYEDASLTSSPTINVRGSQESQSVSLKRQRRDGARRPSAR
jgi:hypothetical protein